MHHPKTKTILSQKVITSCLRASIVVNTILYILITFKLSHLESNQRESVISNIGASLQRIADKTIEQPHTQSSCASTILYYYASSSLIWLIIIFWKKRRRKVAALLDIFTAIIILIILQFNHQCTTTTTSIIAKSINSTAWFNNYSSIQQQQQLIDDNVRISFSLHDPKIVPVPDKFSGVVGYRCGDKADLPTTLSKSTILNFTTSVSTNLKILFIGDSIAEQFAQAFDATVLGSGYEEHRVAKTYRNGPNNINVHNCLSVSAPVRGGGVTAFWRIATLMSESTRRERYLCEHGWKTWSSTTALDLIGHQYTPSDIGQDNNHHQHEATVSAFDAVVLRIPHGWLTLEQITRERIYEAIKLSNIHTDARTVIISTLPLNNNVITSSDWIKVAEINHIIRDIARTWRPNDNVEVQHVLVQEFGNFTNQILRMNAEHIQLTNTATPDFTKTNWELSGADFLLKRLSAETFWSSSICMVCAQPVYPRMNDKNVQVEDCIRNKISRDGIHWCVETLGPRFTASIACLLGCVYNGNESNSKSKADMIQLRQCEQECNDQFMTIRPVDEDWIRNGISLYSKSSY